jgi:hypothetical protein
MKIPILVKCGRNIFTRALPGDRRIEYRGGMTMAYRIEYGKNPKYPVPGGRGNRHKILWVIGLITVGMVGIYVLQSVGVQKLLPGDPAVTGAALDAMMENLKQGNSVAECFTVFCQEIVAHAKILE